MRTLVKGFFAAGLVAVASSGAPTHLAAQRSGVEIWSQNCGNCHMIQPANRYTAGGWESVVAHMTIVARLTDAEADAVLEFLKGGAKPLASSEPAADPVVLAQVASIDPVLAGLAAPDGAQLYAKECVACHGKDGKGDGPVASALNPRPTDLTDLAWQDARSDTEVAEAIGSGKGTMPGFGGRLTPEQVTALVGYVRQLRERAKR